MAAKPPAEKPAEEKGKEKEPKLPAHEQRAKDLAEKFNGSYVVPKDSDPEITLKGATSGTDILIYSKSRQRGFLVYAKSPFEGCEVKKQKVEEEVEVEVKKKGKAKEGEAAAAPEKKKVKKKVSKELPIQEDGWYVKYQASDEEVEKIVKAL